MVTQRDHELPILPGIRFGDGVDLGRGDGLPRVGRQRVIEHAFDHARVGGGYQFWPGEIGFHEFIGHAQSAAPIAVEQMMAARQPEIIHVALAEPDFR